MIKWVGQGALLVSFFTGMSAFSGEISVQARTYLMSCTYYTSIEGDFIINYNIPRGEPVREVLAIYGYGGRETIPQAGAMLEKSFDWDRPTQVAMHPVGPGQYEVIIHQRIAERSTMLNIESLQFLFKVTNFDGRDSFERGAGTKFGYFQVDLPKNPVCINAKREIPIYRLMDVRSVSRN